MKASDWVAMALKSQTDHVFGITGGAVINLLDSIHKHGPKLINLHHEQACAMAADAYARLKGFGCCIGTSGPGATNLITGTCCSWFDSVPVLTIAGQVPTDQLKQDPRLRQLGFQETDTLSLFKGITKDSRRLVSARKFYTPVRIQDTLLEAMHTTLIDRKGPVFLEFPDDSQREDITGQCSPNYTQEFITPIKDVHKLHDDMSALLKNAKRPVLIIGAGAKNDNIRLLLEYLHIPVFLTWGAMDFLDDSHPLNMRDFGVTSQRAGNMAIRNADLVIALGTRLDSHCFVDTKGKLMVVDIDEAELSRHSTKYKYKLDTNFIAAPDMPKRSFSGWISKIKRLRNTYPIVKTTQGNPYLFFNKLSKVASNNSVIITDAGQNLTWTMQTWKVKLGQRLFSAFNHSPMGYSLPASIGAAFAEPKKDIICIIGDGGLQMNLQELNSIVGYGLPIKIFVINNNGYGMIKQTQSNWDCLKDGVACEPYLEDLERISKAFSIPYYKITKFDKGDLKFILGRSGPVIIEVMIKDKSPIEPKLKMGDEFDDLTPKLTNDEKDKIDKFLQSS